MCQRGGSPGKTKFEIIDFHWHQGEKMERVLCPRSGEPITSVEEVRDMIGYYPEKVFQSQCRCGQKYNIRISFLSSLILSFPDRPTVLIC
jgi:hypothetical protein